MDANVTSGGRGAQAPRLRVGLSWGSHPPFRDAARVARLARLVRLDYILFWDHVQSFFPRSMFDGRISYSIPPGATPHDDFEAFTALGRLSAVSGHLQLGVGVTDVLRRHPIALAQAAVTLSHLTGRPFILGLGAGERMGTEPYGLDGSPSAERLEDAARFIRAAFDAAETRESFSLGGRYFHADHAIFDLRAPAGARPPIWIAAHAPRALGVAGRQGDGWYPHLVKDPAQYERLLGVVRAAAADAGRDPSSITPAGHVDLLVAPSEREARELLDSRLARWVGAYAPAWMWREVGASHPLGDDFGGYRDVLPERLDPAMVEELIRAVPLEVVERRILWGTSDQVVRQVEQLFEAGLRAVTFLPLSIQTSRLAYRTLWTISRISPRVSRRTRASARA
jgi:phthiodiolone/phenolphthiodiolone dimycocerosates ketoreductase